MSAENRLWDLAKIAIGLLPAVVSVGIAYNAYLRGPIPGKHVELTQTGPVNLLSYFPTLGASGQVALSITINKQAIKNLVFVQGQFENVGASPILPSDYVENLSVNVTKPWRIIDVENPDPAYNQVQLRWKAVNDQRFEAEPALVNPGDRFAALVYLTNTQSPVDETANPKVVWGARIANLRGFDTPPSMSDRISARYWGIYVQLAGWSLPYTIGAALLFQALYLHLLVRAGLLRSWGWLSMFLVLGASLLSFAAAESSATYIFGDILTEIIGVNHWLNAPFIVLHVVALLILWQIARARSRQPAVPVE